VANQEVRHGDAGLHIGGLCRDGIGHSRVRIGEDAVVVQQGLLHVLLQVALTTDKECVLAACRGVNIAKPVDVRTGDRAADLIAKREETAHGDLRELRWPLHVQFRAIVGQRLCRLARPACIHACVAEPDLIYSFAKRPYITRIGRLLAVAVVGDRPRAQARSRRQ